MKRIFQMMLAAAVLLGTWTAAAGNWSEAEYQTAYRLLEACNTRKTLEQSFTTVLELQIKANPQIAQFRPVLKKFMQKYVGYEAIRKPLAESYLELFSQAELEEMIRFFESPLGQKMAKNQEKLVQRGMEIAQQQMQAHLPELQMAILQEVQKRKTKNAGK